uniref:BZIP domain-containing protein n=1 Tax=Syphacia muris TaxID=451379 RepID=A0A0N5ABL4_9BILA
MDNHSTEDSNFLQVSTTPSSKKFHLSLTKKSLTKLLPSIPADPKLVSSLDCSRNDFKHIDCLGRLENCEEVNASYNKLVNLTSFTPMHHTLKVLDVSHNEIVDTANLSTLEHLEILDASYNIISGLPVMSKMANLVSIVLKCNRVANLASLRGISKLQKLRRLDLSKNKITNLHNADRYLPVKLKCLDLSGNGIADLTEAYQLIHLKELDEILWCGNPCVPNDRKFDYRPFLLCCLQNLKCVDSIDLSEYEILRGELLLTRGKWRRYQTHDSLCEYLAEECSRESCACDSGNITEFEKQVKRVIAKRREYLSLSNKKADNLEYHKCDSLPPSPFTQWTEQDPNRTSVSEIVSCTRESGQKENRPPEQTCGSSDESVVSSTTVVLSTSHDISSSMLQVFYCYGFLDDYIFFDYQKFVILASEEVHPLRVPKKCSGKTAVSPFRLTNSSSRIPRRSISKESVEKRLEACESRCKRLEDAIVELSKQNEQLSETNEQLVHIIEGVNEKIMKHDVFFGGWKKLIHLAIPVPVDLKYERKSPTEVLLKWSHCHGFTVNEDFVGKAHAVGNQTLIGGLLPDREATIKVHCYVDDIEGERSLPVYIPPYCGNMVCQDDKKSEIKNS